ncbi:MAG: DUF2306 domain-containing protein, partial [Gammaproteobacteria bacterium]|nr:DUF2306 domain-containing protein [Gammaproteobacteria bacterium]
EHPMQLPVGVLAVYAALAVWMVLLVLGLRRHSYGAFLGFGLALLLVLNVRYFIDGATDSIAFFIGIYDVLDNLGASPGAAALASCPDNACTVWGDRYLTHPSWGVAFHERFLSGPATRTNLLYGHIFFNSVTFVLLHLQLLRTGLGNHRAAHRTIGRISFASLTLGTVCAVWLAGEHGPVGEYGGSLSMFGFWFMSLCVYGCAVRGIIAIRSGDSDTHRIWMIRFAGSMWGAFWLFRVMLFVLGPLLRNHEAAALLICIWFSAPLGILIAEVFRRQSARRPAPDAGAALA